MERINPPWGFLGLDQYLLKKWDRTSSQSPNSQRRYLAREFVSIGREARTDFEELASKHEILRPSSKDVQEILEPFRTAHQRLLGSDCVHWLRGIWLRTCYDPSFAGEYEQIIDLAEPFETYNEDTMIVLDDQSQYDFENDWNRILELIPEMSQCRSDLASVDSAEDPVGDLKTALAKYGPEQSDIIETKCHYINIDSIKKFLIVVDREALTNLKPRLIYLDQYGNIIKHCRISAFDLPEFPVAYRNHFYWDRVEYWQGDHFEYGLGHSMVEILESLK